MDQQITKQSVSISTQERKIVNEFRKNKGLNFSAALRFIINEWHDLKEERLDVLRAGSK